MAASGLILAILLIGSLLALGDAGLRLSSLIAPAGLERVVSWAVLVAAAAVLESLGLGVAGLGGSPSALAVLAGLTWAAARAWLPAPRTSFAQELGSWWESLPTWARLGIGAIAGAAIGLVAILLHRPQPGFDGLTYHLADVVGFVQSGHPGRAIQSFYDLPVGNYPLTNEVLLAWPTGISHGLAAQTLWSPICAMLVIAAGTLSLRRLRVGPLATALAVGALVVQPLLVSSLSEPGTDLPSLAWLLCCCALVLSAQTRPLLLAPAIVAFGLAVGTKTTVGLFGAIVLGAGLWCSRHRLKTIWKPLAVSVAAAIGVGGVWYSATCSSTGHQSGRSTRLRGATRFRRYSSSCQTRCCSECA